MSELWKLANAYPSDFLRGFFDAEGHADIGAKSKLSIAVGAYNCDRLLLEFVKRALSTNFGIYATIHLRRLAGTLKVIRNEPFFTKRASYSIYIQRLGDIVRFSRRIGFSIRRKQEKLNEAIKIYHEKGPKLLVSIWKQLYSKYKGEWLRIKKVVGNAPRSPQSN